MKKIKKSLDRILNFTMRELRIYENIKQIKRIKNIDIEKKVNDLFFKISNLMEIDKKIMI
ncbi:MAG TPA: hypothetical protein DEB71_03555 [Chryseobacterium carnipullorum]|nr:hypothetical protein [Chryseobacterium carnipullorum]